MNSTMFNRATQAMRQRINGMVGRGTISSVDDGSTAQALQIEMLADESHDSVERFHNYGFTSHPLPGAEVVVAFVGGLRSHGIVLGIEDRRYRLKALEGGEVALYDDQGQTLVLKRDGIEIDSAFKVTVAAPVVIVESDDVSLGGEGGPAVARIGDTVSGGVITSGSSKVKAA